MIDNSHGVEEQNDPRYKLSSSLNALQSERHEDNVPLTKVIGQRDVLEETIDDGGGLEGGGGLLNEGDHFVRLCRNDELEKV